MNTVSSANRPETSWRFHPSVWLGLVVAVALLFRIVFLVRAPYGRPTPWGDPDHFLEHAQILSTGGHGWHWDREAFLYRIHPAPIHPLVKAPLYPMVLSLFALIPAWYQRSAALMQVALGTAAVAALYLIGREIHSPRAGLIAAAIYAMWLPAVSSVHMFLQEQLHVPLLLGAFALLVRVVARPASLFQFGVAGGALGLAALARSMPLYFVGPGALLYVAAAGDRRLASRQALTLVCGFLVVVLPWCVYISASMGQLILIDNMGSAALATAYPDIRPDQHTAPPATVIEAVRMVGVALWRAPLQFASDRIANFRGLFRLVGWQWLQLEPPAVSRMQALALETVAHIGDVLFAVSAVLAPFGVVLARRRREASLITLWVGLYIALLVMFAWSGVRYRAPYEPLLIVLAAVVLSDQWARGRPWALGLALTASLAIGLAVAASVPEAAGVRASYGFKKWTPAADGFEASIVGEAGFSVFAVGHSVALRLSPAQTAPLEAPVRVHVLVGGEDVDQILLDNPGRRHLRYASAVPLAYVELRATFVHNQRPAPIVVGVAKPRQ